MEISLVTLFKRLAFEVDLDPLTVRYCLRRICSEGVQFLTITLPKLSKAVLASLELGYFDRSLLTDFAWKGKSLRYFRSFLNGIFDPKTGVRLQSVDSLALYRLRQLCDYAYKLALPFSDRQLEIAEARFEEIEAELDSPFDENFVEVIRKDLETNLKGVATATVKDVFAFARPRPGPGTFSSKSDGPWYAEKYFNDTYPHGLSAYSGYFRFLKSSPLPNVEKNDNPYSQVLFVPKDSRGPRVISREPFSRLKTQMAFFDWCTNVLARDTSSRVMFHDQQRNREVARSSSLTREYATIDLKDASDRVRLDVCKRLFRHCPALRYFITRVRTQHAKLPSGKILRLRKLSGMGSGLTFPIMSLLIYLVSVRTIATRLGLSWRRASKLCGTYGDDLYIPSSLTKEVTANLKKVGLVVNVQKSFAYSNFRESCGGDYYAGQDVTPIRLKLANCELTSKGTRLFVSGEFKLLALERHCRELVKGGLLAVSDYLYSLIESKYGSLPLVSGESPVIGRYSTRDTVLASLQVDEAGNYKPVRVLLAAPVVNPKISLDHYHVLGSALSRLATVTWADRIFGRNGSAYSEVSIPRSCRVRRSRVNGFMLAG